MEGIGVAWFQLMHKSNLLPNWSAFTNALEEQFGPSQYDSPRARLFKLTQTSSAASYYTEFMVLANRVIGLPDDAIIECFVSGLKHHLRRDILAHEPTTLIRAANLAKLYDDTGTSSTLGAHFNSRAVHTLGLPSPPPKGPAYVPRSGTAAPATPAATTPFKRLSAAELRAKREKGLCYYCDEKFSAAHKCKPTFHLLLGQDELMEVLNGIAEPEIGEQVVETGEPAPDLMSLTPEISLHALQGDFHPRTLRMMGTYKKEQLKILIDNGSTFNFVKASVARRLRLPMTAVPPFRVLT